MNQIEQIPTLKGLKETLNLGIKHLQLKSLIALYYGYSENNYAEVINFDESGIMTVRPFTEDSIGPLRSMAYSAKEKGVFFFDGIIPSTMLYISTIQKTLVWKVPRSVRKINSRLDTFPAGEMTYPDMVFMIKESNLYAWAHEGDNLYMLCLPNYDNKTPMEPVFNMNIEPVE